MNDLSFNEIVKAVEGLDRKCAGAESFKAVFLRNITLDLLIPPLRYLCYRDNLCARIEMGSYDNALQDIAGSQAEKFADSDLIVICQHPRVAARKLYAGFAGLSPGEIDGEVYAFLGYIEKVLEAIRKKTPAPIFLHNCEIPAYPAFGILDYQDAQKQANVFRKINQELLRIARAHESVYIIDMDILRARIGSDKFLDERFWHIGRAPYSRDGCLAIAKEYIKFIRSLRGKNKKCLVLDCDNTLWGGIIGEDGLEGIKLGHAYPGSCYREFQESILDLYKRGVLLALCSKNNQADVEEVLEKHPDMVLRKEHFVAMKLNWTEKALNLREIAKELDIGLDSLVFVDDNEFEANMVRSTAPEIATLLLPKEPSDYRRALEEPGYFDTVFFSEEDRKRSEMYRAEMKRKEVKAQFTSASVEEYLKYLEMKVGMNKADPFYVPRISQLTQRTNQFNLTAKRYSESEISGLIKGGRADVFYVSVSDRFGESGVVGAAIVLYEGGEAVIDTFLLSCRVIGRGIEDVMLKVCVDEAIRKGCGAIRGVYVRTKKNQQVESFYDKRHFTKARSDKDGSEHILSLDKAHMAFPPYFKLIRVGDIEHLKEEN